VTSTPGTRPRDHGIPTSDYLVDQSSRCLGVAVRVLPRSSDRRCTWMTIVVDRGTCEGAAGPDSPEIYRGCGWAPDTPAPRISSVRWPTRLGCNSLGTAISATGRAWLQLLARPLGDSGATAPLSRQRRSGVAAGRFGGRRPRQRLHRNLAAALGLHRAWDRAASVMASAVPLPADPRGQATPSGRSDRESVMRLTISARPGRRTAAVALFPALRVSRLRLIDPIFER